MTEAANARLRADGWAIMDDDGFINLVGPLWHRLVGRAPEYAILGQDKHRNRRGVVQGGVLMTLADRTCGMTARFVSGADSLATIQMDTHFIDAARIGELMISRPHAVRTTKSLIFMTTQVSVDDRLVATAHGVFKVMRDRTHPAHPHV
ncbi:MAG TPA: PaaI family thioesterase [Tardiphaga sp.]